MRIPYSVLHSAIRNTLYAIRDTQYAIRHSQYAIRYSQYAIRYSYAKLCCTLICVARRAGSQLAINDNTTTKINQIQIPLTEL